jgi:hypothetical protein
MKKRIYILGTIMFVVLIGGVMMAYQKFYNKNEINQISSENNQSQNIEDEKIDAVDQPIDSMKEW